MTAKQAERALAVIMAAAGVLLLLSLFGVLGAPWPHSSDSTETEMKMTGQAENGDLNQNQDVTPPPAETDEEIAALGLLPLADNDPDSLTPGGTALRSWPADSVVPLIRDVTRTSFVGRDFGPEALSGITVILDAAHGGADNGQGVFTALDDEPVYEKTITLKMAQMLGERLRSLGANVIYTRTDDTELSLFYRVAFAADYALLAYGEEAALAGYDIEPIRHLRPLMSDIMRINQSSADSGGRGLFGNIGTPPDLRIIYDIERQYGDILLISLQTGFSADESIRGAHAVYMSNSYIASVNNGYAAGQPADTLPPNYAGYNSEDRFRLAGLLQAHIVSQIPSLAPENEPVREEDMAVLRLSNLNSAVIELGMLSNPEDRAILTDDESLGTMANALTNAVYQYYCLP